MRNLLNGPWHALACASSHWMHPHIVSVEPQCGSDPVRPFLSLFFLSSRQSEIEPQAAGRRERETGKVNHVERTGHWILMMV